MGTAGSYGIKLNGNYYIFPIMSDGYVDNVLGETIDLFLEYSLGDFQRMVNEFRIVKDSDHVSLDEIKDWKHINHDRINHLIKRKGYVNWANFIFYDLTPQWTFKQKMLVNCISNLESPYQAAIGIINFDLDEPKIEVHANYHNSDYNGYIPNNSQGVNDKYSLIARISFDSVRNPEERKHIYDFVMNIHKNNKQKTHIDDNVPVYDRNTRCVVCHMALPDDVNYCFNCGHKKGESIWTGRLKTTIVGILLITLGIVALL